MAKKKQPEKSWPKVTTDDGHEFHCAYFEEGSGTPPKCWGEVTKVILTRMKTSDESDTWYVCDPHAFEFAREPEFIKMIAWSEWISQKGKRRLSGGA
jgi:hypothetical protein